MYVGSPQIASIICLQKRPFVNLITYIKDRQLNVVSFPVDGSCLDGDDCPTNAQCVMGENGTAGSCRCDVGYEGLMVCQDPDCDLPGDNLCLGLSPFARALLFEEETYFAYWGKGSYEVLTFALKICGIALDLYPKIFEFV